MRPLLILLATIAVLPSCNGDDHGLFAPAGSIPHQDAAAGSAGAAGAAGASAIVSDAGSEKGPMQDAATAPEAAPQDAGAQEAIPPACVVTSLAAGDYGRELQIDGRKRKYQIHVPVGLGASPAPVVLAFHGGGHTAKGFEAFAHLAAKSDAAKFVLVEPDGLGAFGPASDGTAETWNAGNCCSSPAAQDANDVGFVEAILDSLAEELCVDDHRVFATGFSNGAMLSHRLACELSDRIAAIAAVSGGMGEKDLQAHPPATIFACNPARAMPILHIHGTHDACYPFKGGWGPAAAVVFEPVMDTVGGWVKRNGCAATAANVYQNAAATCVAWDCTAPGDVTLCTIDGAGHYWPGGDDWPGSKIACGLNQGARSKDLIANDFIWEYFASHPMP